ncbi:berberine-like protein [Phytophthora infestans T30-4]|uniref:Berberine-like protein n=2 Tax=Phytophthora infestans TaxID=4787 RepID=D0N569_PHYIT|nr:berberine-like protein [Phytophthora infestans T30-4]EEY70027.1 berberine-like protein [Phytophthora infestans T30-4]KAF4148923.1 Berberine and berberine like domain-containing protein [Phytophthora infestans]|eukprot:XP_002998674.1 berberine-like protein [Phytophthora infestans T30-4]
MVTSVSGATRAIFALCSVIAANGGFATGAGAHADVGSCLTKAGTENSVPTTTTWTMDIQPWNSRVNPVPNAVAFPKTEKEVTAALKCAASAGVKVTTLGGNRSFSSMGFGRNDGALLLSFGGPVMISEGANFMWNKYKRTLPHGRCPDVGMTGVAASGFGTLSRASGTVLDNIESVRVALANGSIVNADANHNSHVYWGVRGAASSMGVVLDFKIKTLEPPSERVTNYTIAFNSSYKPTQQDNVDALIGTQTWALSKDNNDMVSIRFSLKTKSALQGFFYRGGAKSKAVLCSLMKTLPASMVLTTSENDFWTSENISTPGLQEETLSPRRFFYIASVTIPRSTPLDNASAWELFSGTAFAPKLPDALASGFVDIWGGAYAKTVKADASAWKHDDNLHLVRWDMPSWMLTRLRGVPAGFTTYRDEKWTVPEMAEYLYGGGNFKKLQQIKTEVDPSEMFNTDPQAIPALA